MPNKCFTLEVVLNVLFSLPWKCLLQDLHNISRDGKNKVNIFWKEAKKTRILEKIKIVSGLVLIPIGLKGFYNVYKE